MVILTLKLILFVVLTTIPFLYHFLVKPRRESQKRYRNIFTAMQPQMTRIGKLAYWFGTRIINFYDKMERTKKARKFFTLLLVLFLIGVQAIDNFASGEVASTYKTMARENRLEQLSVTGKRTAAPFMQRSLSNCLYPFLTRPIVYLITFGITLLFFSYKLANWMLSKIHNANRVLIILSCLIILFSFFDEGRYMLLSEVLFVITMAGLFYPNFHGKMNPRGKRPMPQENTIGRRAA